MKISSTKSSSTTKHPNFSLHSLLIFLTPPLKHQISFNTILQTTFSNHFQLIYSNSCSLCQLHKKSKQTHTHSQSTTSTNHQIQQNLQISSSTPTKTSQIWSSKSPNPLHYKTQENPDLLFA